MFFREGSKESKETKKGIFMAHNEANINWKIERLSNGNVSHADAQLAVLMDIRLALQDANRQLGRLNDLLYCDNFVRMPRHLARIAANTARRKRKRLK